MPAMTVSYDVIKLKVWCRTVGDLGTWDGLAPVHTSLFSRWRTKLAVKGILKGISITLFKPVFCFSNMDVMKPTLINIGGRCYRKMPFSQKIEHHSDQVSSQHYEGTGTQKLG